MGRKKLEIKKITAKKRRGMCFKQRYKGLLRKASELSTLCEINITIITSDTANNLHVFSNLPEPAIKVPEHFLDPSLSSRIFSYNQNDYPFSNFRKEEKLLKVISSLEKTQLKRNWADLDSLKADCPTKVQPNQINYQNTASMSEFQTKDNSINRSISNSASGILNKHSQQQNKNNNPRTIKNLGEFTNKLILQKITQLHPQSAFVKQLKEANTQLSQTDKFKIFTFEDQMGSTTTSKTGFIPRIDSFNLQNKFKALQKKLEFVIDEEQGNLTNIKKILLLTIFFEEYISESPSLIQSKLREIPPDQVINMMSLTENSFLFPDNTYDKAKEFLDFGETALSTSSEYSFESFSFLSSKMGNPNTYKTAQNAEKTVHKRENHHLKPPSSKNRFLLKRITALNHVIISILLQKVDIGDVFNLASEAALVKIPYWYDALDQEFERLLFALTAKQPSK